MLRVFLPAVVLGDSYIAAAPDLEAYTQVTSTGGV